MVQRTLLLNSTYEPLRIISWQRAVGMVCLEKVEVLKSYPKLLRAISWTVPMPAVVRLNRFVRRRRLTIAMTRRNLFMRDGYRCQYCLVQLPARDLTCDHVTPRSQGGQASWENLVAACGPCNRRKGGRTPEQARMHLAKTPVRPETLPVAAMLNLGPETPESWQDFIAWARRSDAA